MTLSDRIAAHTSRIATLEAARTRATQARTAAPGADQAIDGSLIGGRALNGPARQPRGGPCQLASCGRPVPETSRYTRWCSDQCRRRASGEIGRRPVPTEAQRCAVCRERKRKAHSTKCEGCYGQDRRRSAAARRASERAAVVAGWAERDGKVRTAWEAVA